MRINTLAFLLLLAAAPALNAQSPPPPPARPVAVVNGEAISATDLEQALADQLDRLQGQLYETRRRKLDELIETRLLAQEAARRSLSVDALLEAEVNSKLPAVTDEEVHTFYEANKKNIEGEEAARREEIRDYIRAQKQAAQRKTFVDSLRKQATVAIQLELPPFYRAVVSTEGAPARGPATAPVTIIKFEDFHCPFCRRAHATLQALQTRYGDKLRIVHKDLPLEGLHPGATRSHVAARCAGEQGKFWEYQDKLYESPPKPTPEKLKDVAQELGLDVAAFESCSASNKYDAAIAKDYAEGEALGITGTPGFFINGRVLRGAQPIENFVRVIEQELSNPAH
ncbi:MAG TPA: thioredoxin domain-containing protein [Candidatus Acidoferrales bacterium]|nr:thioredoxin domain-containing protein [Candidatus Acidoferrales bacterium]